MQNEPNKSREVNEGAIPCFRFATSSKHVCSAAEIFVAALNAIGSLQHADFHILDCQTGAALCSQTNFSRDKMVLRQNIFTQPAFPIQSRGLIFLALRWHHCATLNCFCVGHPTHSRSDAHAFFRVSALCHRGGFSRSRFVSSALATLFCSCGRLCGAINHKSHANSLRNSAWKRASPWPV